LPDFTRARHLFIRQQTALIDSIRAHLAELGIVTPVRRKGLTELLRAVADLNKSGYRRLRAPALPRAGYRSARRILASFPTGRFMGSPL
jgi:hypothetical protein